MNIRPLKMIIAGGGTGGHLFPGIALAKEFISRNMGNQVLFVNAGNRFEREILSKSGFQVAQISTAGIKGQQFLNRIKAILAIPQGIWQSVRIILRFKPDIVLGVGGFASGPPILAATLLGIKTAICEQNIIPGTTNRFLFYLVHRVYLTFRDTRIQTRLPPVFIDLKKKLRYFGNPVRHEMLPNFLARQKRPLTASSVFTILIIGGSQGAHAINLAIMEALPYLTHKDRFFFIHQTGAQDLQTLTNAYAKYEIAAVAKPFFYDMAGQYLKSDLIICRAGATTMAEITVMGKSAIFIPYPFAADNHQEANARVLARQGGAEIVLQSDISGSLLADKIEYLAANPIRLATMSAKAGKHGKPDAAKDIIDDSYGLISSLNTS
jgi:UDP-N-acetylglucosamine--N-acetylmuramyl-(pentapeptide) pyrophosphoryl-undecaprenol N-acetylglucosamine transferase